MFTPVKTLTAPRATLTLSPHGHTARELLAASSPQAGVPKSGNVCGM